VEEHRTKDRLEATQDKEVAQEDSSEATIVGGLEV